MARQTWRLMKRPDGKHDLVPLDEVDAWIQKYRPETKTGKQFHVKRVKRGSWVLRDGKLIPRHLLGYQLRKGNGLQVIKDIEPFLNIAVDWKPVGGRKQRRDMMRAHGLTEVGNDRLPHRMELTETRADQQQRVNDIKSAFRQHGVDIL